MIKIIIDIASYLEVPTIAEGVESKEQVAVLKNLAVKLSKVITSLNQCQMKNLQLF